jgi:hypothetical protein
MKTIWKIRSFACLALVLGALLSTTRTDPSDGDFSYLPAKVIAHLPLSGGARQMCLQQEDQREYLYVRQPSRQAVTLIDVTKPERPKVITQLPLENLTMVSSGLALAETPENSGAERTSLAAGNVEGPRGSGAVLESVRVLDVSDPAHPRIVQSFDRVTNILQDSARNLIYVATGDGVWIVSHPQVLRRHGCRSSDAISPMPNCD